MGATNPTPYYDLSQFVGTDKPAWLQDYNGDMLKIDSGINAAKVAADSAALDASAAQLNNSIHLGQQIRPYIPRCRLGKIPLHILGIKLRRTAATARTAILRQVQIPDFRRQFIINQILTGSLP